MEEERERLLQDLERYRAILDFATDKQATAAIEQLIRETRERLDRLEGAAEVTRR